jgi:hypothetical protein
MFNDEPADHAAVSPCMCLASSYRKQCQFCPFVNTAICSRHTKQCKIYLELQTTAFSKLKPLQQAQGQAGSQGHAAFNINLSLN